MVEVDWLLSDERVFPISIDPSVATTTSNHGTCYALYYNYGYCYKQTTGGSLWRWAGGTFDSFTPFVRFDLSAIPSTATISQMTLTAKISYAYYGGGYQWNQPLDLVMMQNCGNSPQLSTSAQTTCTNGLIDPFFSASYTYGGCGPGTHACARSAWGSDTVASKGWLALGGAGSLVSGDICSSPTTCAT